MKQGEFVGARTRRSIVKGRKRRDGILSNGRQGSRWRGAAGLGRLHGAGVFVDSIVVGLILIITEPVKGSRGGSLEFQNLPGGNEKDGIRSLVAFHAAVKQNDGLWMVGQQLIQMACETVELSQIQWPKIEKEIPIHQFFVDVEENGRHLFVLSIPQQNFVAGRWSFQGTIIQAVLQIKKEIPTR